jgi:hypothetical protein
MFADFFPAQPFGISCAENYISLRFRFLMDALPYFYLRESVLSVLHFQFALSNLS